MSWRTNKSDHLPFPHFEHLTDVLTAVALEDAFLQPDLHAGFPATTRYLRSKQMTYLIFPDTDHPRLDPHTLNRENDCRDIFYLALLL